MDTKPSAKEYYRFFNGMVCMVKGLEGKYTAIDFRNESSVTGKIVNVDGFMNIEMEDCHYYNSRGEKYPFESFFCKARNIRYVHIPSERTALQTVQDQLSNMKKRKPPSKKPTFKEKRAKQYQKELLLEIAK